MRTLFFLLLASPAIKYCMSHFERTFLAAAFIAHLATAILPDYETYTFFHYWLSFRAVFYFSLGIFLRHARPEQKKRYLAPGLSVALALLALASSASMLNAERIWRFASFISVPFILYFTWEIVPAVKLPKWLVGSQFPIYVTHAIVIWGTEIAFKKFALNEHASAMLIFILGAAIPVIFSAALRNLLPRFASVIFGGR